MTTSVVDVAQAAAAGDLAVAAATLDGLQRQLDTAIADENVTADRAARIQLSLDAVRADLEVLAAAASGPDPADVQVPAEPTAPVVPPADVPVVTPAVDPPATDGGSVTFPSENEEESSRDKKNKNQKDDSKNDNKNTGKNQKNDKNNAKDEDDDTSDD